MKIIRFSFTLFLLSWKYEKHNLLWMVKQASTVDVDVSALSPLTCDFQNPAMSDALKVVLVAASFLALNPAMLWIVCLAVSATARLVARISDLTLKRNG